MKSVASLILATALSSFLTSAGAQGVTSPLRLVVGVAPGGSVDATTRVIGLAMQKVLGRPVVVENKPGASMLIATKHVIASKPDGDVLLVATGVVALNPFVYPKESVNPLKDLTPVALMASAPMVLAVSSKLDVKDVHELVTYAKANPGKLNIGVGSASLRVIAEKFMKSAGIDITTVPYSGVAPALNALVTGDVQLSVMDEGLLSPHIKGGRVRALVTSSSQRSKSHPEIPTSKEVNFKDFDSQTWTGLFAPPNTSAVTVQTLHEAVQAALAMPEVGAQISSMSFQTLPGTTTEFRERIKNELDMNAQLSKRVNLQAQ